METAAAGAWCAVPLSMDRYDVTLRLECPDTRDEVRLPFPTPVHDIDRATPRFRALLAAARGASRPYRLPR